MAIQRDRRDGKLIARETSGAGAMTQGIAPDVSIVYKHKERRGHFHT